MRLISFGKRLENLYLAVSNRVIGSDFTTFELNITKGEKILFVCNSQIWGQAEVDSNVSVSRNIVWKDKLYPYRANISKVEIFSKQTTFKDFKVDEIFRESLGKQWAYKILFTPGEIPEEAERVLGKCLSNIDKIDPSDYEVFFSHQIELHEKMKRKRLGLAEKVEK